MSSVRDLQLLVEEYRAEGNHWPASAEAIAAWALTNRRWEPSTRAALRMCSRDIAEAMREDYWTDPKGRRVRAKHPMRTTRDGENLVLWDDIRTAPREHMEVAFQQRRNLIVAECRQLKTDVDSFNDFGKTDGRPIQLVLNFTHDVEELEVQEFSPDPSPSGERQRTWRSPQGAQR